MTENDDTESTEARTAEGATQERRDITPGVRVDRPTRRRRSRWTAEDAERYRFKRVPIPEGLDPVDPVRICNRNGHHYLMYWHPGLAKSITKRATGTFTDVYLAAREVQKRILEIKASRPLRRILNHEGLVREYLNSIEKRVEAGDVQLSTLKRYRSALRYYREFTRRSDIARRYPDTSKTDGQFVLDFETYLRQVQVSPNGHANSAKRPMRSMEYVVGIVRAMFEWARTPKS